MSVPLQVVMLSGGPPAADATLSQLNQAGYELDTTTVRTEAEFLDALRTAPDVIIGAVAVPGFGALQALDVLSREASPVPLVVVTDPLGDDAAVQCMKRGAADYVLVADIGRLGEAVLGAMERARRAGERRTSLNEQHRMMQAIMDASSDLMVLKDSDSIYRLCSESLARSWGRSVEEMIGKSDFDLFPPDVAVRMREDEIRLMQTGEEIVLETSRALIPGGDERVLEAIKRRVCDEAGQVRGLVVTLRDVTEHKRLEEQLARRVRELSALYETSLELNAQSDTQALLQKIVRGAADLTGAKLVALALWDEPGRTLRLAAAHNFVLKSGMISAAVGRGVIGRVAETGEPLLLVDYPSWPRGLHEPDLNVNRVIGVPVLAKDGVLGVLLAGDDEQVSFDESHLRVMRLFASQAAVALERADHQREIERRNRELTVLYEALRAAASSLDLGQVVNRVVHALSESGDYPWVSAYVRRGEELVLSSAIGFAKPAPTWDAGRGVHGRVLRTGQAQFVVDVQSDPDYVAILDSTTREICVPILVDGQVAATLNIESTAAKPLTDADFRLMQALADQLNLVMRNALLHEGLQTERDEVHVFNEQLLALQKVALAMNSQLAQPDLIEAIVRSAAELVGGDSGGILLLHPDSTLTLAGSFGLSEYHVRETRLPIDDSVSGLVVRTGQAIIVDDVPNEPLFKNPAAAGEGFLSMICAPLRVGSRVIGTLNIHSSERTHAFNERHLQVFGLLANQAAVAIENARLYTAMSESESRFRALFERSLDGIVLVDLDDARILDANRAFERMIGYTANELRGLFLWDLHPPEHREAVRRRWVENRNRTGPERGPVQTLHGRDGQQVKAEFSAFKMEAAGRSVLVSTLRDVTEKLQLEEQLRQAQKMEAIGTLAGGIAHDFNNILGAILGYASFVKKGLAPDDPLRDDAETIEVSALRGADLTRQLLAFARGGRYELSPLSVNSVANEVTKLLRRTMDKSILIESSLDPELPLIEADHGQIQQLLLNLCINAAEAMPGGGLLTVHTEAVTVDPDTARRDLGRPGGDYIQLTITDTGEGMSPETLQRLFEPFYSTKKNQPGRKHTGLGLAVVFGIVKGHNGAIRVDSEPGRGTTFRVWLPARLDLAPVVDRTPAMLPFRGEETILVVDDEDSLRALLQRVLSSAGYQVIVAADGVEAISLYRAQQSQIRLVVLDMFMPGLSGQKTYERLRKMNPSVRVLIASGFSEQGDAQDILAAGARGFIQKPFQTADILAKVRSILDE